MGLRENRVKLYRKLEEKYLELRSYLMFVVINLKSSLGKLSQGERGVTKRERRRGEFMLARAFWSWDFC